MTGDRGFELLSAAADGDLSDQERAELEQWLQSSPAARRLQAELAGIEGMLSGCEPIEPPPGLQQAVLERISLPEPEAGRTVAESVSESVSESLAEWFGPLRLGRVLSYGFSAAFGALLVIAIYESQPNFGRATDIDDLVGTMAPDARTGSRKILDSFSFAEAGVASTVRLERRDDALVVDVRIETVKPVEIEVDFSDAIMEFEALAQTLNRLDSIQFANRVLRVRGQGDRRFAVLLRSQVGAAANHEATIRLQYSSEGTIVRQGVLRSVR